MCKPLLFYAINERSDVKKYCKARRLKPYKVIRKKIDGYEYDDPVQYIKSGFIYDVLECNECYSGHMITLMRLPKLSYEELFNIALTSKFFQERAGAIGIILKDYKIEFENYLLKLDKTDVNKLQNKKQIKRMADFISGFVKNNTSYVLHLEKILTLCEKLYFRIK